MIIPEKICKRCKKPFVAAPQHRYKIGNDWYCRYNCYIADFKEIEEKSKQKLKPAANCKSDPRPVRQYRKGVRLYDQEGKLLAEYRTLTEASDRLGYSIATLSRCCAGERNYPIKGYVLKYGEGKR